MHDAAKLRGDGPGEEGGAAAHSRIAELAYSYWETRGGTGGSALEDWLRAERELKERRGV
jgi:hypothetical protein